MIVNELSYKRNIGAMETFKFYQVASPEDKVELKRLLAAKKYKEGWDLIQKVTGVKLQGLGTESVISDYDRAVMEGGHSLDNSVKHSALREAIAIAELTRWKLSQPTQSKKSTTTKQVNYSDDKRSVLQRAKDAGNKNWFRIKEDDIPLGIEDLEELDEDWKSALGNLAIAGAIGAGGAGGLAAKDAFNKWRAGDSTPAATAQAPQQTRQIQAPIAKSAIAQGVQKAQDNSEKEIKKSTTAKKVDIKPITDNPLESTLFSVAKKSGLRGTELAAFMAQCAHETLDFKRLKEIGGKLDFKKYDPKHAPKKARALGNKRAGDGELFKGRGFIQLTGRHNYKVAGQALGLPLEQKPQLVEEPNIAAEVAVWFWKHRVQPNVDNFNDVGAVTKLINPGMRGLADREENFKEYMSSGA